MRLLYVVQRYGDTIAGGAEQHCREMAERMARRGHHVEVATTCAKSYVDWANAYEPGESVVGGVLIHRFRGGDDPAPYAGIATCYIEFGGATVARFDVNFLGGPSPSGVYAAPSLEQRSSKQEFGSSRRQRWFGSSVG